MGVETGWGKNVIQGGKYEELESAEYRSILEEKGEIPEIESSLGIGLVQVTGENQGSFIRDLYQSLPSDSPERAHIEEYFGVTEEYMMSLHSWEPAAVENAAGYIYMYYPVEASTWYWAQWKDRRTTINDFIVSHKDDNLYNTFMCTQMMLNGTRFVKEDLDRFAGYETNCVITTSSKYKTGYQFACPDEPEKLSYGPNGWGEREKDWNSAQGLLNEKANKE